MKSHRPKAAFAIAFAFWLTWFDGPCSAQSAISEGEQVRVLYLRSWIDGVVVGENKKQWVVEFEFASSPHTDAFDRENIRKLCEVDALDYARSWASATGSFTVEAALKNVASEGVVLIKPDLTEITVPLKDLSAKDQAYVTKLQAKHNTAVARGEVPAARAALPEIEYFGGESTYFSGSTLGSTTPKPLGTLPSYLKDFSQAGVGFKLARDAQDIVAAIPVGGPDQLVLMTAREDDFFHRENPFQSQLYWVSFKQKKVISSVTIAPEDFAVDYDPRNKLLLTFNRKDFADDNDEPDHYTIWKLPVGAATAEPLVRWQAEGVGWAETIFAKLVNERIVVAKTGRQTYEAWNFVDKKPAYSLSSASFFDAPIILSFDRNHLIIPEDGNVCVVDAATGESLLNLRVDDRHVSGANINAEGTRLAALTERNVYVWDLKSPETTPKIYPAPLIGSPFESRISWVDDDHILAEANSEQVLYRLSLELPIWSYQLDLTAYWENRDPMKSTVINGHFFYIAKPFGSQGAIAVGAVKLPGPRVAEITKSIDRESLYILKPGVSVSLDVQKVSDRDQVTEWLKKKISDNGWIYSDSAEICLVAEMGVGKSETVEYREFGINGKTTTATFAPHYSSLVIKQGDLVIWQSGTSTGPPPVVFSDNVQSEINRYQNPQLEFFRQVDIDAKILDPKYSHGFGLSKLGLRGIEVVSTTPPGRPSDPVQAESKSRADQVEAFEQMRAKAMQGNQ